MNTINVPFSSAPRTALLLLGLSALFLAACSDVEREQTASANAHEDTLTRILLDEAPANPLSVAEARRTLKPGDKAVIEGQIGGTNDPFIEGYAGFVLADPELVFCNEMGEDHCATPWDACCEDPDKVKAMRLSVQFVDAEGQPLTADWQHGGALSALDQVTIVGEVSALSTADNLIIEAESLYR
jgi:hypothetical protein